jgi:hypothetical protein
MIQNYRLLKESATKFEEFKGEGETSSPQIQKIYSTAHFLVMTLRFLGVTKFLYIGRGGRFQGLYWFSKLPDPKYRIQKDRLLELFRKHLKSARLNKIEVLDTDRLFILKCGSNYKYLNLYWFIKGSQAYVSVEYQINETKIYYYHFWETKTLNREDAPNDFLVEFESLGLNRKNDRVNKKKSSSNKQSKSWTEESYQEFLEKESEFQETSSKKKKKLLRKIENIKSDIVKLEEGLQLELLLKKSHFDIPKGHKVKICGIKLIFKSDDTFYQKRDKIFNKFKRIKWAYRMQLERLDLLEKSKSGKPEINIINKVVQPVWFHRNNDLTNKDKAVENEQSRNYSVYKIRPNVELAVGKNAKGNDYLRNKWGYKNDTWFHIEGHTGSHLIVKGELLPDDYSLIGSILKDYSKLDVIDIPLIYAKLSKVKGLKGRAGAVTIKNPRHMQVIYNADWAKGL